MNLIIATSKDDLGRQAAQHGAEVIRNAIAAKGHATIIVATGASQFEMLGHFIKQEIPWPNVTAFHLDEYVGVPLEHPASFRKYLWERFVSKLPLPLEAFHYVKGEGDATAECHRLEALLSGREIDLAFVGIGENAHLAFNDPPADFETTESYLVVYLDEDCRRQQLGEGWFKTLAEVPTQAISMSCQQILKAKTIIVSAPDARKAKAVQACLEGAVSPLYPASILQQHKDTTLYLDAASAALLKEHTPT